VTCSDGMAQPPQPSRITTPNGRGRWVTGPMMVPPMNDTRLVRTTQMISCRKRRSTSRTTSSPKATEFRTHQELRAASPRITARKPGRSIPASQPTTAESKAARSTASPRRPRPKTRTARTSSTTVATSHPTPLV